MEGHELRRLRNLLQFTQSEMAQAVDVASNTLARWERGELRIPANVVPKLLEMAVNGPTASVISSSPEVARDPRYREILKGLEGKLNPHLFEECAVELVRQDGWSIAHVKGGKDDGFDGAIADGRGEPFPLVVTTGSDHLRNLRRSLKRAQAVGWQVEKAIFATSRHLTGQMRRKLRDEARSVGVKLVQTIDRDWFASRLYSNPSWCKSLLNITGRPSALSIFPKTQRPIIGDTVRGREGAMRWLKARSRDCLLVGGPGVGKTFLLRALALEGHALFLVDGDREKLANDIRELRPGAVIIDDAHVNPELLTVFTQLREEVGAEGVRIIATSWPGAANDVRAALNLPEDDVLDLELIDADTIVEIVKSIGLSGSSSLLRLIREQAAGRPGLAATLAHLCLLGDVKHVVSGDALTQHLMAGLDRLLKTDSARMLAPFALGGTSGARVEMVADYLGIPMLDLSARLAHLAAAGVVWERSNGVVSVEPPPIRRVLVRNAFFSGAGSLDHLRGLNIVQNRHSAIETMVGARSVGAHVVGLEALIEDSPHPGHWLEYASLGPSETEYVLSKHPDLITVIAEPALRYLPHEAIALLLDRVPREDVDFGLPYGGPDRFLKEWAVSLPPDYPTEEIIHRRSTLVQETARWVERREDHRIAIRAMCMALDPQIDYSELDPGSGSTLNITEGIYPSPVLEELTNLWPKMIRVIEEAEEVPWRDVFNLVDTWFFRRPTITLPERTQSLMQHFGERMLRDLAQATRDRPGIQHRLGKLASRHDVYLELALDADFELAHPAMLDFSVEEHNRLAEILAGELGERSGDHLASSLDRIVTEERRAGMQVSSGILRTACDMLAREVRDPLNGINSFIKRRLPSHLLEPFLREASSRQLTGWEVLAGECLNAGVYDDAVVSTVVRHPDPPPGLLADAISRAADLPEVVQNWCAWGMVPENTLRDLLLSGDDGLAAAAAFGHWREEPRGAISEPYGDLWRRAITRCVPSEQDFPEYSLHTLGEILSTDGALAMDWLTEVLDRPRKWFDRDLEEAVMNACQVLSKQQRRQVLDWLPNFQSRVPDKVILQLIGDDLEFYRELLGSSSITREQLLLPLGRKPDGEWIDRTILVMDVLRASIDDIRRATLPRGYSWSGSEGDWWSDWRAAFEELEDAEGVDPRIHDIAGLCSDYVGRNQEEARQRDRIRSVYVEF